MSHNAAVSRSTDLFDQPVRRGDIEALAAADLLDQEGRRAGLNLVRSGPAWATWVMRSAAAVGAAMLLIAAIFFVAHNWQGLDRFVRLALPVIGCAACAVGGGILGPRRFGGRLLIIGAIVLVGVCLAVLGQVYQTGGELHHLYMAWAAITVPWVLLSRSPAAWCVWLAVCSLWIWFGWFELEMPDSAGFLVLTCLTGLYGAALAAREEAVARGASWLDSDWTRIVPGIGATGAAGIALVVLAVTLPDLGRGGGWIVLAGVLGGGSLGAMWWVGARHNEIWIVAAVVLAVATAVVALVCRILLENGLDTAPLVLSGMVAIGVYAFAAVRVRALAQGMAQVPQPSAVLADAANTGETTS